MAQETWPLCDRVPCQVCKLCTRLVEEGASLLSGTSVGEGDCCIQVSFERGYHCQQLLRLDEGNAVYRLQSRGKQTKMCDFAIFARQEEDPVIVVVEIKNTPRMHAIDQLQAGLDVIYRYLSPNPKDIVNPRAYVVVNKQIQRFMNLLRAENVRLQFGTLKLQPRVKRCGTELRV